MERIYKSIIDEHFNSYNKMLLLSGPRQVGKTTLAKLTEKRFNSSLYLNWDNEDHQRLILRGPSALMQQIKPKVSEEKRGLIIFDEIHKYTRWKTYVKGFYDTYKNLVNVLVTGSAKLDVYRQSGDSMKGRYFSYRVHPLSVAELLRKVPSENEICFPSEVDDDVFHALYKFGGFPEPFSEQDEKFLNKWKALCNRQLFREDVRDLSRVEDIAKIEKFARLLNSQIGQLVNYRSLANKILVSEPTIKNWLQLLSSIYYCYLVSPWHQNISRSLVKQPKIFLWDWSDIENPGARAENFIANHLLKAIHFWTDNGLGEYELYFLRDKQNREIDFLVTKNNEPWFLVEVKLTLNSSISKSLYYFQEKTGAKHAFQVVLDLPYIDKDCFASTVPVIVSARTFLSQLV
jgi:predicted AAA+ superfamily ATPase